MLNSTDAACVARYSRVDCAHILHMKRRSPPRHVTGTRRRKSIRRERQTRPPADIGRQLDAIYVKMDLQLTRMAELQLQLDELRAKIRRR